jgi:glycosyltransferase involved in cell wall biosynthesis
MKKYVKYCNFVKRILVMNNKMKPQDILSPMVSVVMPTYNHANFISDAINSILSQTYTNWELIIVDNFSLDGTMEIVKKFNDPRIRFLQVSNEGIVAKSRNLGMNAAKGSWVAFLDSDDIWFPNKLKVVSEQLNDLSDLLYHHMVVLDKDSQEIRTKKIRSRKLHRPILKDLLLNGNTIATSSVVVRKQCILHIGGMSESKDLIGTEDYNTWLRIANVSNRFKLIPQYLGAYRSHALNLSKQTEFKPPIHAVNEFLPLLTDKERYLLAMNNSYTTIRIKFMERSYQGLKPDLYNLMRRGTFSYKIKSACMLLAILLIFNTP